MKISVSLPEEDVRFLDDYAQKRDAPSRSAVVQQAVRLLRVAGLEAAYAEAWREWESSGDADTWDSVLSDGLEWSDR